MSSNPPRRPPSHSKKQNWWNWNPRPRPAGSELLPRPGRVKAGDSAQWAGERVSRALRPVPPVEVPGKVRTLADLDPAVVDEIKKRYGLK